MPASGNILIVDDDQDILVAGRLLLKRHFASVTTTTTPSEVPALMAKQSFDAILLDMNFGPGASSGEEGYQWLEKILEIDPEAVVVMITAHGGVNIAVDAMKKGATDFVAKPWQNEKVVATLSSAVQLRRTRSEADTLRKTNKLLSEGQAGVQQGVIIGSSAAMENVMQMVERAGPTEANILILGENGTGKELIARAVHEKSHRAGMVFMTVDLGAVSESLFESELFGHKKGTFTDARDDRVGRLVAASGGTLFLDEIGNLPLHLQAKLLTVLEQRKVTPLGANAPVDIDVRLITATNVPRSGLSNEDRFRQDLLFRLNTVEIELPPLRARGEDIPVIAAHFAALYAKKYDKQVKEFSPSACAAIEAYSWPGNVRALRHAVERAVILSEGVVFEAQDFSLGAPPNSPGDVVAPASTTNTPQEEGNLNLEKMEYTLIEQALKKHRYNISHAAKALGLTRAALYRRMEKHGF